MTAEAAEAVDENRKTRPRRSVAGESRALRRPGGAMLCGGKVQSVVNCGCGMLVVQCASFAGRAKQDI